MESTTKLLGEATDLIQRAGEAVRKITEWLCLLEEDSETDLEEAVLFLTTIDAAIQLYPTVVGVSQWENDLRELVGRVHAALPHTKDDGPICDSAP